VLCGPHVIALRCDFLGFSENVLGFSRLTPPPPPPQFKTRRLLFLPIGVPFSMRQVIRSSFFSFAGGGRYFTAIEYPPLSLSLRRPFFSASRISPFGRFFSCEGRKWFFLCSVRLFPRPLSSSHKWRQGFLFLNTPSFVF